MNVIETAKLRLKYTRASNEAEAVALIDLTIERAQRLIAELTQRRTMLADQNRQYEAAEVLGWAQNDAQNFARNLDPDRWMRVAGRLVADVTVANLIAGIESEG